MMQRGFIVFEPLSGIWFRMSVKNTLSSLLILLTLQIGGADAGPFSFFKSHSSIRWVSYIGLLGFIGTIPTEKLRVDKRLSNYFSSCSEHHRLQVASRKINEALQKEDDSMLVLALDIDETVKYRGKPTHQATRHAQINSLFESLRLRNKLMLIYNTNRSSPITVPDIVNGKSLSQQHDLINMDLHTLPRPDILIRKGGKNVCYLSEAVEYMRSIQPRSNAYLCGYDNHSSAFHEFWEYNFITPSVRRTVAGRFSSWHYRWRLGGAEAVYRFQPDTMAEVQEYLTEEFSDPFLSLIRCNLPGRTTRSLTENSTIRHGKGFTKLKTTKKQPVFGSDLFIFTNLRHFPAFMPLF